MKRAPNKATVFFALVGAWSIGAAPVIAKESSPSIEAGKALYKETCRNCHGPTAKGMASYPRLVGHPAEYLSNRLKRYRAGEKIGPNTPLMTPHAKNLSDEDIANIVAFMDSLAKR